MTGSRHNGDWPSTFKRFFSRFGPGPGPVVPSVTFDVRRSGCDENGAGDRGSRRRASRPGDEPARGRPPARGWSRLADRALRHSISGAPSKEDAHISCVTIHIAPRTSQVNVGRAIERTAGWRTQRRPCRRCTTVHATRPRTRGASPESGEKDGRSGARCGNGAAGARAQPPAPFRPAAYARVSVPASGCPAPGSGAAASPSTSGLRSTASKILCSAETRAPWEWPR